MDITPTPLHSPAPRPLEATETAAAAETAPRNPRLDTSRVPFRVSMEVAVPQSGPLQAIAARHGWMCSPSFDCSHGYQDSHPVNAYWRIQSPDLLASEDTFKHITSMLKDVQGSGAQVGHTSAMRICVNSQQLDLPTQKGLLRIQTACEPILYRAGRNGNSFHHGEIGWGSPNAPVRRQGGYYFCTPLSHNPRVPIALAAASIDGFCAALDGPDMYWARHQGFQPRSRSMPGFSEFRFFTTTLDPDVVRADAEMVLGMVRCAYEDRWPADLPAQSVADSAPLNPRTWQAFRSEVLGDAPSAARVEQLYQQAASAPRRPDEAEAVARLSDRGFRFAAADGAPFNLERTVAQNLSVAVTEPGQEQPYHVQGHNLADYTRIQLDPTGELPGFINRQHLDLIGQVSAAGVSCSMQGGTQPLTPVGAAIALGQGRLQADLRGERIQCITPSSLSAVADHQDATQAPP